MQKSPILKRLRALRKKKVLTAEVIDKQLLNDSFLTAPKVAKEIFTKRQILDYRNTFKLFDVNHDKILPQNDIKSIFTIIGHEFDEVKLPQVIKKIQFKDPDYVNEHEFLKIAALSHKAEDTKNSIMNAFHFLAQDYRSGKMKIEDLFLFMTKFGDPLNNNELIKMFNMIKAAKKNYFNYKKFVETLSVSINIGKLALVIHELPPSQQELLSEQLGEERTVIEDLSKTAFGELWGALSIETRKLEKIIEEDVEVMGEDEMSPVDYNWFRRSTRRSTEHYGEGFLGEFKGEFKGEFDLDSGSISLEGEVEVADKGYDMGKRVGKSIKETDMYKKQNVRSWLNDDKENIRRSTWLEEIEEEILGEFKGEFDLGFGTLSLEDEVEDADEDYDVEKVNDKIREEKSLKENETNMNQNERSWLDEDKENIGE